MPDKREDKPKDKRKRVSLDDAAAVEQAREERKRERLKVLIRKLTTFPQRVPAEDAARWTIALNPDAANVRHNSYTYTHPVVGTFPSRTKAKEAHLALFPVVGTFPSRTKASSP